MMVCASPRMAGPRPGCGPPRISETGRPQSYAAVVRAYIRDYRDEARRERRYYAVQRSLVEAVQIAALSKLPSGKRHPHQRRIPRTVLQRAADALATENVAAVATFDELHETVRATIGHFHGIGELTVYDVANRVGAYLGLEPNLVYLHAGTRKGAYALGVRGATVRKGELPKEFSRLCPSEIEDCLCIYKTDLRRLAVSSASRRARNRR